MPQRIPPCLFWQTYAAPRFTTAERLRHRHLTTQRLWHAPCLTKLFTASRRKRTALKSVNRILLQIFGRFAKSILSFRQAERAPRFTFGGSNTEWNTPHRKGYALKAPPKGQLTFRWCFFTKLILHQLQFNLF